MFPYFLPTADQNTEEQPFPWMRQHFCFQFLQNNLEVIDKGIK